MGLVTDDECQLLFVDPPGLLEPTGLMQKSMVDTAVSAIRDANAVLYLHPASDGPAPPFETLVPTISATKVPFATVLSKADLLATQEPQLDGKSSFLVSALSGSGVPELLEWCRQQAAPGEFR